MQKRKGKNRIIEISVVLVVLGGAVAYQVMHEAAAKHNIVDEAFPALGEQRLDFAEGDDVKTELVAPVVPSLQDKVNAFIAGQSAPGLRVYNPHVSLLGEAPQWAALDKYQGTITKSEFLRLLTSVYTVGEDWKKWITLEDDHALVVQSAGQEEQQKYRLEFADKDALLPNRYWRCLLYTSDAADD